MWNIFFLMKWINIIHDRKCGCCHSRYICAVWEVTRGPCWYWMSTEFQRTPMWFQESCSYILLLSTPRNVSAKQTTSLKVLVYHLTLGSSFSCPYPSFPPQIGPGWGGWWRWRARTAEWEMVFLELQQGAQKLLVLLLRFRHTRSIKK